MGNTCARSKPRQHVEPDTVKFQQGDRVRVNPKSEKLNPLNSSAGTESTPLRSDTLRAATRGVPRLMRVATQLIASQDIGWVVLEVSETPRRYAVQLENGRYIPSISPLDLVLLSSQDIPIGAQPRSTRRRPGSKDEDAREFGVGATILASTPTGRYSGIVCYVNDSGAIKTYNIQADFGEYFVNLTAEALEDLDVNA